VHILPADEESRGRILLESQVSIRSPMGAVIFNTGGILIDKGWLRLLGSGHPRLPRSISEWNKGRSRTSEGQSLGFWLIGDDVIGGFFALDGGAFGKAKGEVFYFAPDTLQWEPMNGMGYSEFLVWSLGPSLSRFYQSTRWEGWETETSALNGDQAFSIYPFLCSHEGKDIGSNSRKPCSVAEVFSFNTVELPRQLEGLSE
jgi:hypothetical protein